MSHRSSWVPYAALLVLSWGVWGAFSGLPTSRYGYPDEMVYVLWSLTMLVPASFALRGVVFDRDGRVLGRHRGLIHFTVGQRRGIEIGGQAEPLYVVRLEPETGRVVVGPRRALAVRGARLSGLNWLGEGQRDGLTVKVRSMSRPAAARFDPGSGSGAGGGSLWFEASEYGVSPGQAAVIYDGDRVLGGGWIEETVGADAEELVTASDLVWVAGTFFNRHPGEGRYLRTRAREVRRLSPHQPSEFRDLGSRPSPG